MDQEQRIVHFAGMVQGVGFRYTACAVAERYEITGYVRNLADGRVECAVEGPTIQIDAFLNDLGDRMSGYIHSKTQRKIPPTGRFTSFGVRY